MTLPTSTGELVLITGVNGYIASRTVEAFLSDGYHVRGTVRNKASAAGLLEALKPFVEAGRLEIAEVKDSQFLSRVQPSIRTYGLLCDCNRVLIFVLR